MKHDAKTNKETNFLLGNINKYFLSTKKKIICQGQTKTHFSRTNNGTFCSNKETFCFDQQSIFFVHNRHKYYTAQFIVSHILLYLSGAYRRVNISMNYIPEIQNQVKTIFCILDI